MLLWDPPVSCWRIICSTEDWEDQLGTISVTDEPGWCIFVSYWNHISQRLASSSISVDLSFYWPHHFWLVCCGLSSGIICLKDGFFCKSLTHWSDDYQVPLTRQSSSCIAVVDEVSKSCVRFIWLGSIGYPSVLVWVHILNLCVHSNSLCIHILSLCVHNLTLCSFLKNLYFCPYFHGFVSIIDEETRDWRVLFAIKRTSVW